MNRPESSLPLHSAFYRFVALPDAQAAAEAVRAQALALGLQGSIVLAPEGINGSVAGTAHAITAFEQAVQQPQFLHGAFRGMAFKHSGCRSQPFGRLKVTVKPEIVALALPGADALPAPDEADTSHLDPAAWQALLGRSDVVLLDNRNHFEYRLGHFRGAIDPQVHNFRDFVAFVEQHAPAWRAAARPVAMYCTGGIRCDKTAPWMRSLGLQVWQLQGGVLNYLQQQAEQAAGVDSAHDWLGECFVFDRRIALDARLQESATQAEQVFDSAQPDEAWRLRRARELDATDGPA